ncbi:hypothetical protein LguiB_014256 [Lonicera macranthoides]
MLELQRNQFTGAIPTSLTNISELFFLALSTNNFRGNIPTGFGSLQNLQDLLMDSNFLGNEEANDMAFLNSLTNCSMLKTLEASYNQLGGVLPNSLGNLSTRMRYFGVAMNQISGVIPSGVGSLFNLLRCSGLVNLYLGGNFFEGSIPPSFKSLRSVQKLDISSNNLSGNDFKALVYDLMPIGSLERWLDSSQKTDNGQDEPHILNLHQRINIAMDVACALEYLHYQCEKPIVHCDIKPSNILLNRDMVAHVGDFGLAKFLFPELSNANQSSSTGIRGTVGYVASEYGVGDKVSMGGDV